MSPYDPYNDPGTGYPDIPLPSQEEYGVLSAERMRRYAPLSAFDKLVMGMLSPQLQAHAEGKPIRGEQVLAEILNLAQAPVMGSRKLAEAGIPTVMEEIPSIVAQSYKARKALKEAVPEYSQVVEGLGGVTENAGRMLGEAGKSIKERIGQWFEGFPGEVEGMLQPARPIADPATEGMPFIYRVLGKHGVVPTVPKSTNEILLVKTPHRDVIPTVKKAGLLPESAEGGAGGMYTPLWGRGKGMEGDAVWSSMINQDTIIPHEFSHPLQDILTGIYSKGNRPASQFEGIASSILPEAPKNAGIAYGKSARGLWNSVNDINKDKMRSMWSYGDSDALMKNEFVAELTNPDALAATIGKTPAATRRYRELAEAKFPVLDRFWQHVPDYIPDNAYWLPKPALTGDRASAGMIGAPDLLEMMRGE